jgi:hypothetical protein
MANMEFPKVHTDLERIGVWRLGCCFLLINVPIALTLSYAFQTLELLESLLLRGVVAFCAFWAGGALFIGLVVRARRRLPPLQNGQSSGPPQ